MTDISKAWTDLRTWHCLCANCQDLWIWTSRPEWKQ